MTFLAIALLQSHVPHLLSGMANRMVALDEEWQATKYESRRADGIEIIFVTTFSVFKYKYNGTLHIIVKIIPYQLEDTMKKEAQRGAHGTRLQVLYRDFDQLFSHPSQAQNNIAVVSPTERVGLIYRTSWDTACCRTNVTFFQREISR